MVVALGPYTREGVDAALAHALHGIIDASAGQRLGHGKEEIHVSQARDAGGSLAAILRLVAADGGVNHRGRVNLAEDAALQVLDIDIVHRAVIALDVAIGRSGGAYHATGSEHKLSNQRPVLTDDERRVKAPMVRFQIGTLDQEAPDIRGQTVSLEILRSGHYRTRRIGGLAARRDGAHGVNALVPELQHVQVLVHRLTEQ